MRTTRFAALSIVLFLAGCQMEPESVRAAVKADVILTMASKFRYTPDVAAAKQIIERGLLGEILLLENVFASRVDMRNRWNAQPTVSGGGVLVDNGAHSVDLLRYFLAHRGEVVSREQLLRDVWGYNQTVVTRTVDNFVAKLRHHVEPKPQDPRYLVTVHGSGYQLVV